VELLKMSGEWSKALSVMAALATLEVGDAAPRTRDEEADLSDVHSPSIPHAAAKHGTLTALTTDEILDIAFAVRASKGAPSETTPTELSTLLATLRSRRESRALIQCLANWQARNVPIPFGEERQCFSYFLRRGTESSLWKSAMAFAPQVFVKGLRDANCLALWVDFFDLETTLAHVSALCRQSSEVQLPGVTFSCQWRTAHVLLRALRPRIHERVREHHSDVIVEVLCAIVAESLAALESDAGANAEPIAAVLDESFGSVYVWRLAHQPRRGGYPTGHWKALGKGALAAIDSLKSRGVARIPVSILSVALDALSEGTDTGATGSMVHGPPWLYALTVLKTSVGNPSTIAEHYAAYCAQIVHAASKSSWEAAFHAASHLSNNFTALQKQVLAVLIHVPPAAAWREASEFLSALQRTGVSLDSSSRTAHLAMLLRSNCTAAWAVAVNLLASRSSADHRASDAIHPRLLSHNEALYLACIVCKTHPQPSTAVPTVLQWLMQAQVRGNPLHNRTLACVALTLINTRRYKEGAEVLEHIRKDHSTLPVTGQGLQVLEAFLLVMLLLHYHDHRADKTTTLPIYLQILELLHRHAASPKVATLQETPDGITRLVSASIECFELADVVPDVVPLVISEWESPQKRRRATEGAQVHRQKAWQSHTFVRAKHRERQRQRLAYVAGSFVAQTNTTLTKENAPELPEDIELGIMAAFLRAGVGVEFFKARNK
jgi:hypothetical protein